MSDAPQHRRPQLPTLQLPTFSFAAPTDAGGQAAAALPQPRSRSLLARRERPLGSAPRDWSPPPAAMQQHQYATYAHPAPAPMHVAQQATFPGAFIPQPVMAHGRAHAGGHPVAQQHQYAPTPSAPVRFAGVPAAFAGAAAPTATVATWHTDEEQRRITPLHVGILLTLIVFVVVVAGGPKASLNATPGALPALSPVDAATATLPLKRQPAAIEGSVSPAAASSVARERAGKAPRRTPGPAPIPMAGIPSPAAAATLEPKTLPMRASDGMTLPRIPSQRDDHGQESHYAGGGSQTLPLERAVERPAVTPAQAQAQAEQAVAAAGVVDDMGSSEYVPAPSQPNVPF